MASVLEKHGFNNIITVCCDVDECGKAISKDPRIPLVSFTGSTNVGRNVSTTVHNRFGKTILELGGNNGQIVMSDCDINLALQATIFGAVGTCGQRCTSLRRVFIQKPIYKAFVHKLTTNYPLFE